MSQALSAVSCKLRDVERRPRDSTYVVKPAKVVSVNGQPFYQASASSSAGTV